MSFPKKHTAIIVVCLVSYKGSSFYLLCQYVSFVGKEGRLKLHDLINYAVTCKAVCYTKISILDYMTHGTLSQIFKNESGPWLFPEFFYSVTHTHTAGVFPRAGLG